MLTLVCCGAARDAIDCQSYFTKVGKTKLMPIPLEVPLLPPPSSLLLPLPPSCCCCALPKCKQTHTDSDRDWKLHVPPHCADSPQNSGSCCDFPPLSTPSGKWHARHVEVFPALSVRTRRCRRQHVQSSCYSSSVPQCEVNQN